MTAAGMSAATLVAALLGLGVGVGLLLVIHGWRGAIRFRVGHERRSASLTLILPGRFIRGVAV